MKSREKAYRIINFFDKNFKPRWQCYDETLLSSINSSTNWIDCGCGDNDFVKEYGDLAKYAVGLDVLEPKPDSGAYIQSTVAKIPLADSFLDVASLRFVVEHLPNPENDLKDLQRAMKPGAKLIVLTTNIINPVIALARLFPYSLKHKLITKIFKVEDDDVFPTYHKLNTPAAFLRGVGALKPVKIEYISDINHTNTPFFCAYLLWHIITMPKFMNKFRSNILCVFEKE